MDKELHYIELDFTEEEWKNIDTYFKSYTGVDVENIPARYQPYIMPTREVMKSTAKTVMKYAIVDITKVDEQEQKVMLEGDQAFEGQIISKAYADAKKVLLFVSSVINIDEILAEHTEMMESFFIEYWAVAMLGSAKLRMKKMLDEMLTGTGFKKTSVWSPGQARLELKSQLVLFDILKPETEGIRLDKHMRMLPLKSVSGTMGIVPEEAEVEMVSCDYCEHSKTCPGYEGTKFKDIKNRRLK